MNRNNAEQRMIWLNQRYRHLYQQGRYDQAIELVTETLELTRQSLGEEHPDFAASLSNLAESYRVMGNYDAAEPLYKQAREIVRNALGEEHPDFADSLSNLAGFYSSRGIYTVAEPFLKQSMKIYRTALGEGHPSFANSLNNLAELYADMGDYVAAEPLYKQSMEILRNALGEEHPSFARILNNLARLYTATGRENAALTLMEQAAGIDDRMIGQVFSIGSESQRMAYISGMQGSVHMLLSVVSQYLANEPQAVRSALELLLRRKAVGAEALAAQRDAVLGGNYPGLEPELRELTALRMQIAQKTLAGPGPEGLAAHGQQLAEWNARKEELERVLAHQIPEMNLEAKLRSADRQMVASALPDGFALVEFIRFPVVDFHAVPARGESPLKPARYLAFVLPAGEPDNVQMVDLGEAEKIDAMIAELRESIISGDKNRGARDLGAMPNSGARTNAVEFELKETIFDPICTVLGDCRHLFLAPDGDLTRLPFEVLPTADGRRLIDDYHISYLGAGRDVLRFDAESTGQSAKPMVIADPDFDLTADLTLESPQQLGKRKSKFWERLIHRGRDVMPVESRAATSQAADKGKILSEDKSHGRLSRDVDRSTIHFSRLPGTRVEGESLAGMLDVQAWIEGEALEARLKASRSPQILHLATHGFFLEDQKRDPNREWRDLGAIVGAEGEMGRLSGSRLENPLLRSGLALAGANTWLTEGNPPAEAEDGILTAEDVSGMDLLNTELVVLSACETGLGEIRTGEGVFGLRRAFVLAGAKTLVMSLWKVPDQQTQELMDDFYRRILDGIPRAEALREAQLAMKARYPHPFYWGAFICQGDFSPIKNQDTQEQESRPH